MSAFHEYIHFVSMSYIDVQYTKQLVHSVPASDQNINSTNILKLETLDKCGNNPDLVMGGTFICDWG